MTDLTQNFIPTLTYFQENLYGIGDTIRSIFAFYCFCKENNVNFKVHYTSDVYREFFGNHTETKKGLYGCYAIDYLPPGFLEFIKNNDCCVVSNKFDFVDWGILSQYKKSFLKFMNITDNAYKLMNLTLGSRYDEYCAIHIRCGDKLMNTINGGSDVRLSEQQAIKYGELAIDFLIKKHPLFEIIVFTDNATVKQHFKYQTLKTIPQHTAIGVINLDSKYDAFIEFLALMHSKETVCLTNSGFSFWSSYLKNIPIHILNGFDGKFIHLTPNLLKF